MGKLFYTFFVLLLLLVYSCEKKPSKSNSETSGSGNGSSQRTYFQIGGVGWIFGACNANGMVFTCALNGTSSSATLTLGSLPVQGVSKQYTLTSVNPTGNYCRLVFDNPPDQLPNTRWYSRSGVVNVTSTITSFFPNFNCSFEDVQCFQPDVYFPTVIANGYIVCQ